MAMRAGSTFLEWLLSVRDKAVTVAEIFTLEKVTHTS